jgi:hypothetical protein
MSAGRDVSGDWQTFVRLVVRSLTPRPPAVAYRTRVARDGRPLEPGQVRQVADPGRPFLLAPTAPECPGAAWPVRLVAVGELVSPRWVVASLGADRPREIACDGFTVLAEPRPHEVFGPNGAEVATILDDLAQLTPWIVHDRAPSLRAATMFDAPARDPLRWATWRAERAVRDLVRSTAARWEPTAVATSDAGRAWSSGRTLLDPDWRLVEEVAVAVAVDTVLRERFLFERDFEIAVAPWRPLADALVVRRAEWIDEVPYAGPAVG